MLELQKLITMNVSLNKTLVIEELAKLDPIIPKKDVNVAEETLSITPRIAFIPNLVILTTAFQEAVLVVLHRILKARDIGIPFSFAHIQNYLIKKQEKPKKKQWLKSDFVGDVKKRNVFDVVVEMVKPARHKGLSYCELYARQEHSQSFFTPK